MLGFIQALSTEKQVLLDAAKKHVEQENYSLEQITEHAIAEIEGGGSFLVGTQGKSVRLKP